MAGINSDTKLMLHANGTDGQTTTVDSSPSAHPVSLFGTAQLDTAFKKFGTASLLLDGNSDYATVPDSSDFDIMASLTEDWTVDFQFRFNSVPSAGDIPYLINQDEASPFVTANGWFLHYNHNASGFRFFAQTSDTPYAITSTSGGQITDTNYHHIALVIKNGIVAIYLDGVQVNYTTMSATDSYIAPLNIGRRADSLASTFFDGSIDELRIQKSNYFSANPNIGVTDTITVPTLEYTQEFPDPPTSLVATTFNATQIDLSWVAPVFTGDSAITGYKIERESPEGGGFSTIVADTGTTSTTYSDMGLSGNTEYNYRVSAINSTQTGNPSNEAKDTTEGKPGDPTNLSSVIVSDSEVDLSWDAPLDDGGFAITGYKIERKNRADNSFTVIVADTGSTSTTYNDINFIQSSKLIYRVSTINTVATGDPSTEHTTGNIIASIDGSTELLLHIDDGTFVDSSGNNHTQSSVGTPEAEAVSPKFGSANLRNPGSVSHLRYLNGENLFPTSTLPFTIDLWFKPPSASMFDLKLAVYGSQVSVAESTFFLQIQGTELQFWRYIGSSNETKILAGSLTWDTSTWYHIAVERRGANGYTLYRDGLIVATSNDNANLYNPGAVGEFSIGGHQFANTADTRIDEFRYTLGVARYEGEEFCPQTVAYGTTPAGGSEDIRFNPFLGKHENVNTGDNLTLDKFSGDHYKNYKKE